jgi:hypothetical protein
MTPVKLSRGEKVIAAIPREYRGSGWMNWPIEVFIMNVHTREARIFYLQPDEQPADAVRFFHAARATHEAFLSTIKVIYDETPSPNQS